jgi:hypothetical protein
MESEFKKHTHKNPKTSSGAFDDFLNLMDEYCLLEGQILQLFEEYSLGLFITNT